jgi:peptide/nickel transport system substrate-binding protein
MDTLDPHKGFGFSPIALAWPRSEPLVIYKRTVPVDHRIDFELDGALAERWEQQAFKDYTFHLRKGVKWHDGQDFTSADVVFTFQFVNDRAKGYRARQFVADVEKIEALDTHTVRVQLNKPDQNFLSGITDLYMLPKHVADRGDSFDRVSVGTGPFKVVTFDSRAGFALERFADYWDKGRPALDGVVGHYGLDDAGMLAAFIAQQLDLLTVDGRQVPLVKQAVPDAQVYKFMADYGNSLYFDITKAPYSDIRVRRAMHLVLDRNAMLETITGNEGTINPPGVSGMKDGYALTRDELLKLPGYNPATKQQDIAEAKRLLAEAGYPNGFEDKIIYSKAASTAPPIAEMAASQLKAVGINLTLEGLDAAFYNERDVKGDYTIQLCLCYRMDLNANERLRTGAPLNTGKVSDPELDRLFDSLAATPDPTAKKQLARDIQMLLLDKLYVLPTIEIPFFPVAQPWVRDYVFGYGNPHAAPYFVKTDTWLDPAKLPAARRGERPVLAGR